MNNVYPNRNKDNRQQQLQAPDHGNSPLGTLAQSSSNQLHSRASIFDPDEQNQQDRALALEARYKLLNTARRLLPGEKMEDCNRAIVPSEGCVAVQRSADRRGEYRAYYVNLQHCDSSSCPLCSYRRAEQDRRALSVALSQAKKAGLYALLLTFTVRHHHGAKLADLQAAVATAFDAAFSGRAYQRVKQVYGFKGKVKAWETTYGQSGWHPHLHVIALTDRPVTGEQIDALKRDLYAIYSRSLLKQGFSATIEHGIDIRASDDRIADYIAKFGREPQELIWGASSEIAKARIKQGQSGSLTPFDLLAAAGGDSGQIARLGYVCDSPSRSALMDRAARLYVEYFRTFKGKPRLYWGKDLRKLLDLDSAIEAVEAAEAAQQQGAPEPIHVVTIDRENWRKVCDTARGDLRAELLNLCHTADRAQIVSWSRFRGIDLIILLE